MRAELQNSKSKKKFREKARANLLAHADGLNKMLFERRQRAKSEFVPLMGQRPPLMGQPQSVPQRMRAQ